MPIQFLLLILLTGVQLCAGNLTEAEKKEALDFHNYLRRNVVPRAADMNALEWSDKLADLAQKAANSCSFRHNYGGEYAGLGENLYRGHRRSISAMLMLMFLERELYDYRSDNCLTGSAAKYPMFNTCGHYLQLATASLTEVGCGRAKCGNVYLGVCEYNRGYSHPPYQTGQQGTKCGHYLRTWYRDGLCYYRSPMEPEKIDASMECKINCLNYGEPMSSVGPWKFCSCQCPMHFGGYRCEIAHRASETDCMAQAVTCANDGIPAMQSDGRCKCECPPDFTGERCEVNTVQEENSVFWYFGQQMRYKSFYPVSVRIWQMIEYKVREAMTNAFNNYCKTNFSVCCPESKQVTTADNFVNQSNFKTTENYPAGVLDGSLKVGVHFTMSETFKDQCNFGIAPYTNRQSLLEAAKQALNSVAKFTADAGIQTLRFE